MVLVGSSKKAVTSGFTDRSGVNGMVVILGSFTTGSGVFQATLLERGPGGTSGKYSDKHRADKGPCRNLAQSQRGDCATGTEAGNAPADAEYGRAGDQRHIQLAAGGQVKPGFTDRFVAAQHEAIADRGDGQGRSHDQKQGRIP